jgi:cyanophycinase
VGAVIADSSPAGSPGPGPVALLGSGEYLPVMDQVDADLLDGRPPVWVQLATAAAPEGPASLARWHELGAGAARRVGARQVVVPVHDAESADDAGLAAMIAGAGLVYLSGGSPTFLVRTLAGSATWRAIHAAWRGGAALAGCSAGAMALAGRVARLRGPGGAPLDGLGVLPGVMVLPHFDRMGGRAPDVLLRGMLGPDVRGGAVKLLGIDEDTAVVGNPGDGLPWRVHGRRSAWLITHTGRAEYPAGAAVPLTSAPAAP